VVSLRLVSHSEKKAATYAQEGVNGTTSRGCANEVGNYEESMVAKASYITINLSYNKLWPKKVIFWHASIAKT